MFRRFPPSRQRVLSVAIAAALGGLQAATALAAETPATTESQQALPEVRVKAKAERESSKGPVNGIAAKRSATGTKTDTPLIETPQSLSVISREELELRGVSDIKQALAAEGYDRIQDSLYGPTLAADLRRLCQEHYVSN